MSFYWFVLFSYEGTDLLEASGDNGEEVPPVPIPNTVVKLLSVEDTWWATAWENRSSPEQTRQRLSLPLYSSIAQSVEPAAVNRVVVGSSPTRGARKNDLFRQVVFSMNCLTALIEIYDFMNWALRLMNCTCRCIKRQFNSCCDSNNSWWNQFMTTKLSNH